MRRAASRSYRIDHWSLKFERATRAARAIPRPPCSVSLTRATVTVASCFFYCRFIISCRWSRDCELSLGAHTSCAPSLSCESVFLCFHLVLPGACRTRCRASMFWEVHPSDVPTVHLRPTSLRKKQTRALCWRKSTSAGRAEWLIQLCARTPLPTRLDGNNSSLLRTRGTDCYDLKARFRVRNTVVNQSRLERRFGAWGTSLFLLWFDSSMHVHVCAPSTHMHM